MRHDQTEVSGKALRELYLHQIELKMQNEALRQAQNALEASRDGHLDLYDFAAVGDLTLDSASMIDAINLTPPPHCSVRNARSFCNAASPPWSLPKTEVAGRRFS